MDNLMGGQQAMKETVDVLLGTAEIAARIQELGKQITADYAGQSIILLGALKGAAIFLADLSRQISQEVNVEIDFIKASSYGDGTTSSGDVKLDHVPGENLKDRHVILVEDIVDTGNTITRLKNHFAAQSLASLKVCALLDKPERRDAKNHGLKIDYLGFTIPDKFVVGFGLDYAQRYRNLPYIGVLKGAI